MPQLPISEGNKSHEKETGFHLILMVPLTHCVDYKYHCTYMSTKSH